MNIGGVVRAMKNMGLRRLHLVRPAEFDPYRVEGVAHTGLDVINTARQFDTLAAAVSECQLVVGTTARGRRVRRSYLRPREAAAEIVAAAATEQSVALVFGREDRGLSNEDLDLCSRIVVIPTDPQATSLNLAQAVLILAYEIRLAAAGELPFKRPRRDAPPATREELESLFGEVEASLRAIDFFKAHKVTPIMRTIRQVAARADLDNRESALLKAMAYEVRNFMARRGLTEAPPRTPKIADPGKM
ncbi:MAG: TrmJ/YjtD family RNA methyltransferase [Gemmatimonadota bacterium]|nr:MAG: TrmJ/YjtD family RNA methyltransferase [Gemmatimonadota bacterium]